MNVKELIEKAKEKYPIAITYKAKHGSFTTDDFKELEKSCDVHCVSAFMDGSSVLSIRYRQKRKERTWTQENV